MSLFEQAKAAASDALSATGGGPEYGVAARAVIAELEAQADEKLGDADLRLILDSPFNVGAGAGVRDVAYEAALAAQAEKDAAE